MAAVGETKATSSVQAPRLETKYKAEIFSSLQKQFDIKNAMNVPRLEKIVINCTMKDAVANPKILDSVMESVMLVSGQKPVVTRAKKSIATFKLREGMPIGISVTLRRARMWEFLDRLINVALPRVRDFRGVSAKAFDGRGNYTLGIKEQIIFTEINYDNIDKIHGLSVTMVTSAKTNDQARALLSDLGMPFRK
ncbi:MAG: 50S ribosomal protein L5 [Bdellovibrionaceae bacterium]|nr:50S ribosomal protein L5 [Pseudobdellovibrionaceae bacterium]